MHIRKISIGGNYKDGAMHYVKGQNVLNGSHLIHMIQFDHNTMSFKVWIESDGEILLWKEFNNCMPVSLEYDINF